MKNKHLLFLCCFALSAWSLSAQPQILFSVTSTDEIYTANLDGTGTPTVLISPATGSTYGPVGMYPDFANNLLYIAEGNNREIYTAPLSGGSGTLLANSTPPTSEHFDVYADVPNGRYFFSTDESNGAWVASTDGLGMATNIATSGDAIGRVHGLDYNPTTDMIYITQRSDGFISSINVATGVATNLFGPTDGVNGPRGINIDVANGLIYWTQFASSQGPGQVMVGNIDGTGTPSVLATTTAPIFPHGVLVDPSNGLLYWAEFTRLAVGSRIMVANTDGTGASILYDLPTVEYLRGLEFGQPQIAVPTLGQWGLILLALLLLNLGVLAIFQSRYQLSNLPGTYFQNLPVMVSMVIDDRKSLMRQYLWAFLFIASLFVVAIVLFGYELMTFDLLGSLLAAGLLAFLMQTLESRKG